MLHHGDVLSSPVSSIVARVVVVVVVDDSAEIFVFDLDDAHEDMMMFVRTAPLRNSHLATQDGKTKHRVSVVSVHCLFTTKASTSTLPMLRK